MNAKNIRRKLVGLWKLVDTSPFYKRLYIYPPPGYLTFKKDGSRVLWYTMTNTHRDKGGTYYRGRFGVRGNKIKIVVPPKYGGNATIYFYRTKRYMRRRWFYQKGKSGGSLTFLSDKLIELPILREAFDPPAAGNSGVNMTWRKVR